MAKNRNENNAAEDYLAQIEQDNQQIQRHTGLPWYKASNRAQNNSSRKSSFFAKTFLIMAYVTMGFLLSLANINFLILWLVFGAVFWLMLRDANRKPKA